MGVEQRSGWVTPPENARALRMVKLSRPVLEALLDSDLEAASARADVRLTDYFITDEALRRWQRRVDQITADPESEQWIARAVVAEPQGLVVGHAGFHGPPDDGGMVEVAYSVDPAYRRQGYARAMLRALLRRASTEPGVVTVRATISPDNAASLATIRGFGFTHVGEQWDEEDGRELIFEVAHTA